MSEHHTKERQQPQTGVHPEVGRGAVHAGPRTPPVMRHFNSSHLPSPLREVGENFDDLAGRLAWWLPVSAETQIALRKLLEAREEALRAAGDLPQQARPCGCRQDKAAQEEQQAPAAGGGEQQREEPPAPAAGQRASCTCGAPDTEGIVHRVGALCYIPEPAAPGGEQLVPRQASAPAAERYIPEQAVVGRGETTSGPGDWEPQVRTQSGARVYVIDDEQSSSSG